MSFTDGITIDGNHSYNLFGAPIKTRKTGMPEKKSIRHTVPFMNGYYDFTKLNGEPAWSERTIEFIFDFLENTPQLLEQRVGEFHSWLANVHDKDIYDDTLDGFHWHGSYESGEVSFDETGLQAELKVSFVVYPFKIANSEKQILLRETYGTRKITNQGMPVPMLIYAQGTGGTLTINEQTFTYKGNEYFEKFDFLIPNGDSNAFIVGGNVFICFIEEMI